MAAEWYPTNRIRWKDGVLQQLHLQRNRTWDSVAALWYVQEETEWRDVPTENTQPTQETKTEHKCVTLVSIAGGPPQCVDCHQYQE
jgi:hypothetical protein